MKAIISIAVLYFEAERIKIDQEQIDALTRISHIELHTDGHTYTHTSMYETEAYTFTFCGDCGVACVKVKETLCSLPIYVRYMISICNKIKRTHLEGSIKWKVTAGCSYAACMLVCSHTAWFRFQTVSSPSSPFPMKNIVVSNNLP